MARPAQPSKDAARTAKAGAGDGGLGYVQSVEGCLSGRIGARGLDRGELKSWLDKVAPALDRLRDDAESGAIPLLKVPFRSDDIAEVETTLKSLTEGASTLCFFGTGGSSLGGQALAQTNGWHIPGDRKPGAPKLRPRVRFYDNLDPRTLQRSLARLDLASTRFVAISKSGGTAETLSQVITALSAVKKAGLGKEIPRLFLGVTEAEAPGKSNGLRKLLAHHGVPMLEHDSGVGGRYSALTNVGLIPAMAMGLDARKLRRGAARLLEAMASTRKPADVPAALGAAVAIGLAKERGIRVSVLMPYADRLGRMASWYVQLWAESLGKEGLGTYPIAAIGPVDQHSVLQMLMQGPHEHMVTVLRLAKPEAGPRIDAAMARIAGADYLAGRSVGDLVGAQASEVPQALLEAGRPVRTFDLEAIDEGVVGALLMHFMCETILAGRLLGIDPFDQPGVEAGKILTRRYLERLGD